MKECFQKSLQNSIVPLIRFNNTFLADLLTITTINRQLRIVRENVCCSFLIAEPAIEQRSIEGGAESPEAPKTCGARAGNNYILFRRPN